MKIYPLILQLELKSLQSIAIDHFSDMSKVGKKFALKLGLSTHLGPIHSNAFFKQVKNASVPNLFSNQSLSVGVAHSNEVSEEPKNAWPFEFRHLIWRFWAYRL